jgi:hypothetical protein
MENKMTAQQAKETSDAINKTIADAELTMLLSQIKGYVEKGRYSYGGSGSLMPETIASIKELGYKFETGGRMNEVDYDISWKDIIVKAKGRLFYAKSPYAPTDFEFTEKLMRDFDIVSWGGSGKHWSTDFTDVVVVYEGGVRGPADWFYLNDQRRWAHGQYTAYKETYSNEEFREMVAETKRNNTKNGY